MNKERLITAFIITLAIIALILLVIGALVGSIVLFSLFLPFPVNGLTVIGIWAFIALFALVYITAEDL